MREPLGSSWPNEVENRPFSSDLFYLSTFPRGRRDWGTALRGKRKRLRREHSFSGKIRPDLSQKHPDTSGKNFFVSDLLLPKSQPSSPKKSPSYTTPPPLPHPPHTNQGERSYNNAAPCGHTTPSPLPLAPSVEVLTFIDKYKHTIAIKTRRKSRTNARR